MSLDTYSREELKRKSMIDIARLILLEEKKAMDFRDIFAKIAEIKEYTEEEKETILSQFYTDLNVHGRFMTTGTNMWGLKRWYPVEQIDEDITNPTKKKKKKKKPKKKATLEATESDIDSEDLDIVDGDITDIINDFDDVDEEDEEYEDFDDYDEEEVVDEDEDEEETEVEEDVK